LLVELAREGGANPKALDELDREVVEMDSLVGQLLASARVDFGALSRAELTLADLTGRAVERAGLPAAARELQTSRATLTADATLLARALANLFDNARRHGGGAEKLVVREEPGRVLFEVLDRGPGLQPGSDPFADGTPSGGTRGDGLGLGLKLVKRIALAHRGDAFAANRPDGGARVGLWLPV
jgi:signal transduction histidine kinase